MTTLHSKQTGVVLVIGLLMLLIITIVGVTAMSGTTNNERMTANLQFQTLSFQAAESAIQDNYNIPSVTPAVMQPAWFLDPAPNNYNVDIKAGTPLAVQADASIQFCGEVLPMGSGFCNGLVGRCDMDRIYDVRGQGIVSALGSQEEHLRRGAQPMQRANMPFDTSYCMQIP